MDTAMGRTITNSTSFALVPLARSFWFMHYILLELLKNVMRATMEHHHHPVEDTARRV
jgi:hypothetical protein